MNSFISKFIYIFLSIISPFPLIGSDYFRSEESLELAIPTQTDGTIDNDEIIIRRIINAYSFANTETKMTGNAMWQMFFDQRHISTHNILLKGNFKQVASILRNPASTDLFYGFDVLCQSLQYQFTIDGQKKHAKICLDRLIRLAEAMGAINLENPESNLPTTKYNADSIFKIIGQKLENPISFPNPFPQEHGLHTSFGIISYRVPQAIYQVLRIIQLVKGIENPRILEIGGGLGRTALYSRQLGIEDYTIVDLPFTAVSSGYFLGRILGEDHVLYSGEKAPDAQWRIKFLTPSEFISSNEKYDLIINADGFTEMDPSVAQAYWDRIEECSPIFLSINHEINSYTVKNFIANSKKVQHVDRMPYWMRNGYVEETIYFK